MEFPLFIMEIDFPGWKIIDQGGNIEIQVEKSKSTWITTEIRDGI
jgi:hypothetical protein